MNSSAGRKCQNPPTEVSGPCTQDAWWWAMQGVRTVYSTTWEEKTRKATNPVSQIHSTPSGRHRQHDWPGQAVWIGTGSLWLEEARSRLLCSRPMMMMMINELSKRLRYFARGRTGHMRKTFTLREFKIRNSRIKQYNRIAVLQLTLQKQKRFSFSRVGTCHASCESGTVTAF